MEFEHMNKHDYLARLKEPSTYAGLAAFVGIFGVQLAPAELQGASIIGALVASALAVFMPERKKTGEGKKKKGATGA